MTRSLETVEHLTHAGHAAERLSTGIGISIALLGVLLAFAAAKVAAERTEMVRTLVDQEHAHAKYQAQDIKHRTAVLSLRQLHAMQAATLDGRDMLVMAQDVERYRGESEAARSWVESHDALFAVHEHGQEGYERAQIGCEIGIVIASMALLLRRRSVWAAALLVGVAAIGALGATWLHERGSLPAAEAAVDDAETSYRALRTRNKTSALDRALVDDVRARYGASAPRP